VSAGEEAVDRVEGVQSWEGGTPPKEAGQGQEGQGTLSKHRKQEDAGDDPGLEQEGVGQGLASARRGIGEPLLEKEVPVGALISGQGTLPSWESGCAGQGG
jgi:hypothetical protein